MDGTEVARAQLLEHWRGLGVMEGGPDGPVMPAVIRRRKASGEFEEVKVALTVATLSEKMLARRDARKIAADRGLDPAKDGPDHDYVQEIEDVCLMAHVIREPEAREFADENGVKSKRFVKRYAGFEDLIATFPNTQPLYEIWGVYGEWVTLNDPRYGELTAEEMWGVIASVAREGSLVPLMGIAGREQSACMTLSAKEALRSPNAPSHLRLASTSPSA